MTRPRLLDLFAGIAWDVPEMEFYPVSFVVSEATR